MTVVDATLGRLTQDNFERERHERYVRADRLFALLMVAQYALAVVLSLTLSPRTWEGGRASTHPHVWLAVLLGGALAAYPMALASRHAGEAGTRYAIALSQGLFSALLIHLTGGRVETHFHVFGSLAFLAMYLDWRVLAINSAVIALDHALRGALFPLTIYGVASGAEWRFLEHAGWVLFEDTFLVIAAQGALAALRRSAGREAELELANERVARASAEAEGARAAKGELLSRVSHELRTPLNAILGFGQLLRLDDLTPDQEESVNEITEAGGRLLRLIDGVLDPTIAGLRNSGREDDPLAVIDAAAEAARPTLDEAPALRRAA